MKRFALAVIFVSVLAIGFGYATAFFPGGAPKLAAYIFAVATAALMIGVLILGAAKRGGRLGRLAWVFVFCFAVLAVGFGFALRAPVVTPDAPLWLGLPEGAAIILYIVGVLPLLVLPVAYAVTFERTTLSDEELTTLRARLAQLRQAQREREEVLR